ncbi:hypothetical protein GCM10022224_031860 [Nonomuraea antimicrobica]|uniref:Uncharacterized protein n=1 Tax=Nonomuraea antimicrobica TaxID=561173 RepID=A0ABP7BPA1_9ACTN
MHAGLLSVQLQPPGTKFDQPDEGQRPDENEEDPETEEGPADGAVLEEEEEQP